MPVVPRIAGMRQESVGRAAALESPDRPHHDRTILPAVRRPHPMHSSPDPRGSTDLAAFQNAWYSPGAGPLRRVAWFAVNALLFKTHLLPVSAAKVLLLRAFGGRVGRGVVIKPGVNIKHPWRLTVGHHTWIGEDVWIDNLADVRIGSNCCISQGALLLTGNHDYKKPAFDLRIGAIVIEDGAWAGARTIVCPGVTLGRESVLTAGSVATRDTAAYGIYRGNPAEFVRERVIAAT